MTQADKDTTTTRAQGAPPADTTAGVVSALGAFIIWGLAPIYFKMVAEVPVLEIVAHRVVWSLAFIAVLLSFGRQWRAVRAALASRRTMRLLLMTTVLISINWTIFIWAVADERVLEVSLGYYINPLVNVVFGMLFLGERLSRWQGVAVLLAAAGVVNLTIAVGAPPWAGLTLAVSFGFYALLRKTAQVDALAGLALETALLVPIALGYLVWLHAAGTGSFLRQGLSGDLLLLAAGPVTALPLILFTRGARRLRLSTIGVMQYLAPSMQFLMAVLWWQEPFGGAHLVAYGCIWFALALYTWESMRTRGG